MFNSRLMFSSQVSHLLSRVKHKHKEAKLYWRKTVKFYFHYCSNLRGPKQIVLVSCFESETQRYAAYFAKSLPKPIKVKQEHHQKWKPDLGYICEGRFESLSQCNEFTNKIFEHRYADAAQSLENSM